MNKVIGVKQEGRKEADFMILCVHDSLMIYGLCAYLKVFKIH